MDWLQFIANVLGSLAWPSVVAYFLFLTRLNLSSLLSRVEDLTLPGGAKATFSKNVGQAKDQALAIAASAEDPKQLEDLREKFNRAGNNKEKMQAYFEQTERAMMERMEDLPLSEKLPLSDFIFHILRPFRNSEALYNMHNQIRTILSNANNLPENQIKDNDLVDFINLCNFVRMKFKDDFEDWFYYVKGLNKS